MNKRKLLHTFIVISIILTSSASAFADPLSDLIQEKQIQEQRLQQGQSSLDYAENNLHQIEVTIEKLDVEIENLMVEIDDNKNAIIKGEEDIIKTQEEAKKAEEDIIIQQKLYDQRMRAIYKTGTKGYLQMLVESKSLGDIITKIDAIARITEFDKKVVRDLHKKTLLLEEKKSTLEIENNRLLSLKVQNEQKLSQVNEAKKQQLPLVVQAREERYRVEQNVKEIRDKLNEAKSKIDALYASAPKVQPSRGGAPFSTDNVVIYAYNFIGTKYVYGGTTPAGFDCSGFVKYVYAHFGINLPRTSGDQFSNGTYVSKDDLIPGDLVFFGDGGRISHVGMYVGEGCYIHSPQTGDYVKISVLSNRRYMGARRVR